MYRFKKIVLVVQVVLVVLVVLVGNYHQHVMHAHSILTAIFGILVFEV